VRSDLRDVTREVEINLNGEIRMAVEFLPHLREKKVAAIVNVSSGLAFVPMPISPVYCATKAAVHSFTQSLRVQLKNTSVRVFEVMPPRTSTALYDSDFSKEDVETVPAMDVKNLVRSIIKGIERDRFEIRPGLANMLRLMSRIAPNVVLKRLSKPVDRMLVDPSSS
jgi:uncharacterized oxidoreductase